jgi:transposase
MAREGLRVREVSEVEGNRLVRIVRRSSGSVVTWRRAQMVLLSVQGLDVAGIAKVTFTSADRVREVINNFNADGFDALYPKYAGGRPPVFSVPQRREIKKVALARPGDHGLPFSTWSLSKLARFLVAKGVVDDISHEGLRVLLREEEVSFQAIKTWKASIDLHFEAKKNRVLELYDIAEGTATPGPGDPTVVFSMDESGPLNLQPRPGRQWASVVRRNKKGSTDDPRRRRQRATYTRTQGVRHLYGALDMNRDRLYGHVEDNEEPDQVPGVLPLSAQSVSARGAHRHRHGQLQPSLVDQERHPGRGVGSGQQPGVGLHADQCQLPQPDRVSLHRSALLRPQRH